MHSTSFQIRTSQFIMKYSLENRSSGDGLHFFRVVLFWCKQIVDFIMKTKTNVEKKQSFSLIWKKIRLKSQVVLTKIQSEKCRKLFIVILYKLLNIILSHRTIIDDSKWNREYSTIVADYYLIKYKRSNYHGKWYKRTEAKSIEKHLWREFANEN